MSEEVWVILIGGELYATFTTEEVAKEYAEGEWGEDWEEWVVVQEERVFKTYREWMNER